MQTLNTVVPGLKEGFKILPSEIIGLGGTKAWGNYWYVDGDAGSDSNTGTTPGTAFATIQAAVTAASAGDTIFIKALNTVALATDPTSYAETIIIPNTHPDLTIIGMGQGRVQNGLPQIKPATTSSPVITVRAPGCAFYNLGINGANSTGGGILLDDDSSTKIADGTTIIGCHFKNCQGSSATSAVTGGAIMWSANGGAWQVLIRGNRFYKNTADVVLKGTAQSVPQDVVIEDNVFSGPAATVDCNLFLSGGSGINGVIVRNNSFPCFPAAGTNNMPVRMTGCVGFLSGNRFATSGKTFGASGDVKVPTTVFMADNYQEISAGANATGEIGRT